MWPGDGFSTLDEPSSCVPSGPSPLLPMDLRSALVIVGDSQWSGIGIGCLSKINAAKSNEEMRARHGENVALVLISRLGR